ncbi:hypothetical protein [Nocardioides sp. W7]|uniref:hypothetical protein n=1 Tax=Nocardioides sp. W7 TaxID=2931390 RepID=UPI001FD0E520|nr:hypothetical protein [Nocardioides sp. W7]
MVGPTAATAAGEEVRACDAEAGEPAEPAAPPADEPAVGEDVRVPGAGVGDADPDGADADPDRATVSVAAVLLVLPVLALSMLDRRTAGAEAVPVGAGAADADAAAAAASRRVAAWRITTLVAPHRSRREAGAAAYERAIRSEPPARIATGDETAAARNRSPLLVDAVASCSTACGPRPATGARRTTLLNRGRAGESCHAERRTSGAPAPGLGAETDRAVAVAVAPEPPDGAAGATGPAGDPDGPALGDRRTGSEVGAVGAEVGLVLGMEVEPEIEEAAVGAEAADEPPRSPSAPASPELARGPAGLLAPEPLGARGAGRVAGAAGLGAGAGGADAAGVRRTVGVGAGAAAASADLRAAVAACSRAWSAAISIGPAATVSVCRRTLATSACRPLTMPPGLQLCSLGIERAARGSSRPPSCSVGSAREGASQLGVDVEAATARRSPTARPGRTTGAATTSGEAGIGTHQRGGRTYPASDAEGSGPASARRTSTGREVDAANRETPEARLPIRDGSGRPKGGPGSRIRRTAAAPSQWVGSSLGVAGGVSIVVSVMIAARVSRAAAQVWVFARKP